MTGEGVTSGLRERAGSASATRRLSASVVVGLLVGVAVGFPTDWRIGLDAGWMAAAALFTARVWFAIWPMDPQETAEHANREDPGRVAADVACLAAAVASLVSVGLLLLAGAPTVGGRPAQAALGLAGVLLAWTTVHTIFTTRYARLYYSGPSGGIDFNDPNAPRYTDFAYLAFTIGMTFQVSDTELKTSDLRATALRHALLSYLFGVGIIATMINLVAGLSK